MGYLVTNIIFYAFKYYIFLALTLLICVSKIDLKEE